MWLNSGGGTCDLRQLYLQDISASSGPCKSFATSSDESTGTSTSAPVGWGGQPIADSGSHRIAYFGRNRNKTAQQRQRTVHNKTDLPSRDAGVQQPAPMLPAHARSAEDIMSVEALVQLIRRLNKADALPDRVFRALQHLDSRAVALLLKDLSRTGLDSRSFELFASLRNLPDRHLLRRLCDVYTYTAAISLCNSPQYADHAMELLADMRARGVERNVHTYTALMNVCIKCGKHAAALDIFHNMKAEGCTPNVVTFNTLIDVYGKLGQWERAVEVIKLMRAEGVQPALRTFNTLIIACNMCNQPREALSVYQELLDSGFDANSTTYNALISAYGKMGQLDRVLEVYKDMVYRGLDRSVITYSSLISACEKAERWETALQLFEEMQRDGCTPNTVTYNSLITACGQGAQWEKARQVFEQMQSKGCTPDVVTYTALISALERGGQWLLALDTFQQMVARGCRPDAIVFNAIIDALWQTGVVWAQAKARELFGMAVKQGHFRNEQLSVDGSRGELNLHALTAGVAMLSLHNWLQDIQRKVLAGGEASLPPLLAIVTDAGHASREQGNFIIKEAVSTSMSFWGAPFRAVQDRTFLGVLEAPSSQVAQWVRADSFTAQMAALFPSSAAQAASSEQLIGQRERAAQTQCSEAFGAVTRFEASHNLALQNMSAEYSQLRPPLVGSLLDRGGQLGLKDEVVHDGVLLLDRAASTAAQMPPELQPVVAAAALQLSINQGVTADSPRYSPAAVAEACAVDAGSLVNMTWQLRQLLNDDTMAISTMRCLKVYLERMGYRYLDKQGVYIMAGLPTMLAVEALFDMSLLNCRPSVVAAALLYAERRQRGAVPFWPSMLAKMTGYEDLTTPELACAVRTAQKLCRAAVYTNVYKQQSSNLALQIKQHQMGILAQQQQQQPGIVCMPAGSSAAPVASMMSRAVSGGSTGSNSSVVNSAPMGVHAAGFAGSAGAAVAAANVSAPSAGFFATHNALISNSSLSGAVSGTLSSAFSGALTPDASAGLRRVPTVPMVATPQPQMDYAMLAQQLQQQHMHQQMQQQQQQQVQQQIQLQPVTAAQQYMVSTSLPTNATVVTLQPAAGASLGMQSTAAPAAAVSEHVGLPSAFAAAAGNAAVAEADPGLSNIAYSLAVLGLNASTDASSLAMTLSR